MRRALITGTTGQDGSYLTDLLLEKGYEVHGIVRRTSSLQRLRLQHLHEDAEIIGKRLFLHYADLEDSTSLRRIFFSVKPDEVYHLAGQSHVGLSFTIPEMTCNLTAMGTLRLLEIIRDLPGKTRVYHASSSEVFGLPTTKMQDENTPYAPTTPYGCAKVFATQMMKIYRQSFSLFACNGIMYNHESPRRGENFVTRKICRGAAEIKLGRQKKLMLGNLDGRRDWGYAPDYVRGMWLALQRDKPDDYIFATGQGHSVRDLAEAAFAAVDLDWEKYVEVDPALLRAGEPGYLVGDSSKARRELGWEPTLAFAEFIREMTLSEMTELSKD